MQESAAAKSSAPGPPGGNRPATSYLEKHIQGLVGTVVAAGGGARNDGDRVRGGNLEPTLSDECSMLLYGSRRAPRERGVYVVRTDAGLIVKRTAAVDGRLRSPAEPFRREGGEGGHVIVS